MDENQTAQTGLTFGRIFQMLRRWWWLVFTVIGISLGVAYALLERMTPRYRATATVVVSPTSPRILADIKQIVDVPDATYRGYEDYVQTQLDIIRSQQVSEIVLDRMDMWDDIRLFASDPEKEEEGQTAEQLRLRRSNHLAKMIKAKRIPDSLIVAVSFEHEDAHLAYQMANAVVRAYVDQNLNLKQHMLDQASRKLKALLGERKTTKEIAAKATGEFEKKHNITVVGTRQKEVSGERAHFNLRKLEAIDKLTRAKAEMDAVKEARKKGIFGISVAEVLTNPVLNQLKVRYMTLKNDVSELELVYGPKHHKLQAAKQKLASVRGAIGAETRGILKVAGQKHKKATDELADFSGRFDAARDEDETLGKAVTEYDKLKKELREQTALYDRIRKRYEETMITTSLAEASNNIRPLDWALLSKRPVWPRRAPIMVASGVLGLLLGLMLIVVLERADTTIRDKSHAENLLPVPCLGLVPTIPLPGGRVDLEAQRTRDLYVHHEPLSEPAEHVRTLRANLLFLSAERQLSTLLVTSALPEEGKTTIAIQISITLAAAGGRTCLIEADMRRPRIASTLGVEEDIGLSTFLANRETDFREVVQQTEVPNLDVIVCGLVPPNPAELLNSLRLNQLIAKLHEHYDMVIIDSPPVNTVSDALVMASRVDGVLIVAKFRSTTSEALKAAHRALVNVDAPVIGTVLNALQHGGKGYYRRGRYYRRGYYRRTADQIPEKAESA